MRTAFWMIVLVACSKGQEPPEARGEAARMAPREPRVAEPPRVPAKPSADIPDWVSLDDLDGPPAKPATWKPDGRATLVVFSASWCPGCTASALSDRALVHNRGKDFQIGISLQEGDGEFSASPYAKALSGVPVWSEESTAKLVDACGPRMIPMACLFERGKALWSGELAEVDAVLDARKAGKLDHYLSASDHSREAATAKANEALHDSTKIPDVVAMTHGWSDWQNSVAWDLVDRDAPSKGALALAVALSRDAVALDGGIDFAHLDTYALALSKAGRVADAGYVGSRVIAVCAAVHGKCTEEKRRALEFVARANGRSTPD